MTTTVLHAVRAVGLERWTGGPARPAGGGPRARVVVADDDGDQRLLVEIAARRAGFEVAASVADGDAALERTFTELPDLVVLDVTMPGMSGLEVCKAIRADARTRGVRVALVSAAVEDAAVRRGLEAGTDAYVAKPFRVRDLTDVIAGLAPAGAAPSVAAPAHGLGAAGTSGLR